MMPANNPDEYARLKRIVDGALSLSDDRRRVYLDEMCGSDAALRGEVESLLAATDQAASLYESPALSLCGTLVLGSLEPDSGDVQAPPHSRDPLVALLDEFSGTDRYQVLRRLGGGGMGIVYEVHDRIRNQIVALKTLRRRDGRDIYQLKQEFRNLADVSHPNLAALYDLVISHGQCFFTMELVEGLTFVDYIRQPSGEGPEARARRALPQLIEGVEELHRRGMLHRDIKPSNVLVTPAGRVVILDFGLTSPRQRADALRAGTPAYLSPEQCMGGDPSAAGDWYSVGVTLFQAMSGRLPFESSEPRDLLARKAAEDAPLLRTFAPDIAPEWDEICAAFLARDSSRRITGAEALRRLGARESPASSETATAAVFVGRSTALAALEIALSNARRGRSATVMVYGPSGIGKTALVQRFIDTQIARDNMVVFRCRCHEREAIPYRGLDGIVDGVAQYLATLAPADVAAVLPDDADALATLFPVMGVLGLTAASNDDDPVLLRRRAFAAFRRLIENIARRQPLLVDIDDFHWADADSVAWLTAMLRPPTLPSFLLLLSFRSTELDAQPFLRGLLERVDIGDRLSVALTPMADDEATALVTALGQTDPEVRAAITHASGGNPFLIEALTRHLAVSPVRGDVTLDEMLTRRLEALPAQASAFLSMLAVCGRPVLAARIFEACGFSGDERPLVARLRSAHLVRNSRSGDRVELYHDRIREVLAARVRPDAARDIHALLARVLVAHGDDDPEALFEHYRGAGDERLAAAQAAAAAGKAAGVLAFDLAATFYRHALELDSESPHRTGWIVGLARSLERAGRPVEAADIYLQVARQTRDNEQFESRRKAAELLLIGGQIDRGLAVSNGVLESVGMKLARGPRTAIVSLLWRRARLRWRGLEFTAIEESRIPPKDLQAVDACWAISSGLAMVDPLRAATFNVQQLLRALDVGDPYRVARAMALEAGFSVVGIGAGRDRSEQFSRRAAALASSAGHEYVAALTTLWEGIAAFLTGQWVKASERCGAAATTLRERCAGVTWELNMAHNFYLGGLVSQGRLREVASHLPGLMETARERGNSYLELELSTRLILAWLAADDPDGAQRRGDACIRRWSQRGFQRQHYGHTLMRVQIELYRRQPLEAWRLMEACRRPLRRSHFLRVQHTRVESAHFRARCALAMAAAGQQRALMRSVAMREAERLLRESVPWAVPWATLVHATLAYLVSDLKLAQTRLAQAADEFGAADMQLYAAICRRRLGALLGGEEGRTLHTQADEWMRAQEIRNPAAMAAVVTPGLPEG